MVKFLALFLVVFTILGTVVLIARMGAPIPELMVVDQ